jgi:hypothetical protein
MESEAAAVPERQPSRVTMAMRVTAQPFADERAPAVSKTSRATKTPNEPTPKSLLESRRTSAR